MVPDHLLTILSGAEGDACSAAEDLDAELCHQHVRVDSAALPAWPFLLEALERTCRPVRIEVLCMIRGMAACLRWASDENQVC
jgi:hypothetical protein